VFNNQLVHPVSAFPPQSTNDKLTTSLTMKSPSNQNIAFLLHRYYSAKDELAKATEELNALGLLQDAEQGSLFVPREKTPKTEGCQSSD